MTGVVRIAKESIFSALNNFEVSTIVDGRYPAAMGFTRQEVLTMAKELGQEDKFDEVCDWYDGYNFSGIDIYNPWSVICYFQRGCLAQPYWINTSGNSILATLMRYRRAEDDEALLSLLAGDSVLVPIDESVIYPDIENNKDALYTIMLEAGYLKTATRELVAGEFICNLAIPNREIRTVYRKEVLNRFRGEMLPSDLLKVLTYMTNGNAKAFAAQYQNPLKKEDTDIVALGNEVHEKLGVYFMRRLKKDAAKDLPEKYELKQQVEMPSVQESTYRRVINNYVTGQQPNMLLTIMDIREISEHPYLYDSTLQNHEYDELIDASARLQATIPFLDRIKAKDEKVIIFAERKETQKMLQRVCLERYGLVTKIINGDTPSIVTRQSSGKQSRQSSIDQFQAVDGFNVIIMSPVAAGMGLNVTAANHVIHYSRHWNPAKESQATDRAYRIGQDKDVYVYYPMAISKDFKSFDETLDELLSRKTSLATSTIFPTERVEVRQEELGQMLFNVN